MLRRDYTINGRVYSILLPPPTQAMPLCARAAVLLGSLAPLFADIETLGDPNQPQQTRLAVILGRVQDVVSKVDPLALNQLAMDSAFVGHLSVNGTTAISTPPDFDKHFDEYRGEAYQVLLWCLWECIKDFFPELGASTQTIKGAVGRAFRSQTDGL